MLLDQEPSLVVRQSDRQAALEARWALMGKPIRPGTYAPAYQAYLDMRRQKQEADDALAMALAERDACGTPVPPGLQAKVDQLRAALSRIQPHFEALEATVAREDLDHMAARFFRARTALDEAIASGPPPVVAKPPPAAWPSSPDWRTWRFQDTGTPPQGERGPNPPSARLSIDVELLRVSFSRPWMDVALFTSRNWRMRTTARYPFLSTGRLQDPDPGPVPWRIDGLMLARNLWIRDAGSQGAGSFSMRSEGIQVIGLLCTPMPRCPDPAPEAFPNED